MKSLIVVAYRMSLSLRNKIDVMAMHFGRSPYLGDFNMDIPIMCNLFQNTLKSQGIARPECKPFPLKTPITSSQREIA